MTNLRASLSQIDEEIAELQKEITEINRQLDESRMGVGSWDRPGTQWWKSASFALGKKRNQMKGLVKQREQIVIALEQGGKIKPDRETATRRIQTLLKLAHATSAFLKTDSDEDYEVLDSCLSELNTIWEGWNTAPLS